MKDMKSLAEKQIRPVLKSMKKLEVEQWPMSKADTVRATVYRIQLEKGFQFGTKKIGDVLEVTRIA